RLRVSVLQSPADAHRRGEPGAPALDLGRAPGAGVARAASLQDGALRTAHPPPLRALRRPAAARGDRARAGHPSDDPVRGRADGEPRLTYGRGDPATASRLVRRVRPDDRDGHPRAARGGDRRPGDVPGRRLDRPGAGAGKRSRGARGHEHPSAVIGVALKGLLGRKLRAALTAIAIVLGVAMISGTYVLTDTIKSAFNTVFTQVYKNTDAVISGKSVIGGKASNGDQVPSLPESLVARVRNLPGVAEVQGGIADQAKLVARNGKVISPHGAPNLAFSVNPKGDQRFNPLVLTAGRWPVGPNQIAIDEKTSKGQHFAVGDEIGVLARGPLRRYRIVGIV